MGANQRAVSSKWIGCRLRAPGSLFVTPPGEWLCTTRIQRGSWIGEINTSVMMGWPVTAYSQEACQQANKQRIRKDRECSLTDKPRPRLYVKKEKQRAQCVQKPSNKKSTRGPPAFDRTRGHRFGLIPARPMSYLSAKPRSADSAQTNTRRQTLTESFSDVPASPQRLFHIRGSGPLRSVLRPRCNLFLVVATEPAFVRIFNQPGSKPHPRDREAIQKIANILPSALRVFRVLFTFGQVFCLP